MAVEVPGDIPRNSFTLAGMLFLNGDNFTNDRRVSTEALLNEIKYVKDNIDECGVQTRLEWQLVRNVCLLWCFSHRNEEETEALNSFLKYVGIDNVDTLNNDATKMLLAIEEKHDQSPEQQTSPAPWIRRLPPPNRLPTPGLPQPQSGPHHNGPGLNYSSLSQTQLPSPQSSTSPTMAPTSATPTTVAVAPPVVNPATPAVTTNYNTNPRWIGVYNFKEHQQEYEGHQFQCIFRCLKDGKHCRKAPVREMNRHLRDRHNFRSGFKIAGVDWENKRWRGAGADHQECVGRIVEKESADDSDDSDGENDGYVV